MGQEILHTDTNRDKSTKFSPFFSFSHSTEQQQRFRAFQEEERHRTIIAETARLHTFCAVYFFGDAEGPLSSALTFYINNADQLVTDKEADTAQTRVLEIFSLDVEVAKKYQKGVTRKSGEVEYTENLSDLMWKTEEKLRELGPYFHEGESHGEHKKREPALADT